MQRSPSACIPAPRFTIRVQSITFGHTTPLHWRGPIATPVTQLVPTDNRIIYRNRRNKGAGTSRRSKGAGDLAEHLCQREVFRVVNRAHDERYGVAGKSRRSVGRSSEAVLTRKPFMPKLLAYATKSGFVKSQ
jgi:hypothetical protein